MHDSPTNLVVIYDAECEFCRRRVAWLQARNRAGVLRFEPSNSPGLTERYPALRDADLRGAMHTIDAGGRLARGADAVYQIAQTLPGWRSLAWIYRTPPLRGAARLLYGWIARNRYRLVRDCESGICHSAPGKPSSGAPPGAPR